MGRLLLCPVPKLNLSVTIPPHLYFLASLVIASESEAIQLLSSFVIASESEAIQSNKKKLIHERSKKNGYYL